MELSVGDGVVAISLLISTRTLRHGKVVADMLAIFIDKSEIHMYPEIGVSAQSSNVVVICVCVGSVAAISIAVRLENELGVIGADTTNPVRVSPDILSVPALVFTFM